MHIHSMCHIKCFRVHQLWYIRHAHSMLQKLKSWGHHLPLHTNHYLEDPEPMALLLQLVDHASPVQPSPCTAWPLATPRVDQYMALCIGPLSLANHALKHQSKSSHIYDGCPRGGLLHPHFGGTLYPVGPAARDTAGHPTYPTFLPVLYLHTKICNKAAWFIIQASILGPVGYRPTTLPLWHFNAYI